MEILEKLNFEDRMLVMEFANVLLNARAQGNAASSGTVIDCVEGVFMGEGRDLLRRAMENEVQHQADSAAKKRAVSSVRPVSRNDATKGQPSGT